MLAGAIVNVALARGLKLSVPEQVRESAGAGLSGLIDGRRVSAGSAGGSMSRAR